MTYTRRERKARKAERLREWADKRDAKATGLRNATPDSLRHDWAFITQPGPIRERTKMWNRDDRARTHSNKAAEMRARADGIEAQADHAIYSDDHDAAERLQERIAELEAKRDRMKLINREARKFGDGWSKRINPPLTSDEKTDLENAAKFNGVLGYPSYVLSNIGGNIRRLRKRIEALT